MLEYFDGLSNFLFGFLCVFVLQMIAKESGKGKYCIKLKTT